MKVGDLKGTNKKPASKNGMPAGLPCTYELFRNNVFQFVIIPTRAGFLWIYFFKIFLKKVTATRRAAELTDYELIKELIIWVELRDRSHESHHCSDKHSLW